MQTKSAIMSNAATGSDLEIARALYAVADYPEVITITRWIRSCGADDETKFRATLLEAAAESEQNHLTESLELVNSVGPLVDRVSSTSKARFYGQRAYLETKLNVRDKDGPLVDYEASRYWARESGDEVTEASVRNNLARQYSELGRVDEAMGESDAAIAIATRLSDTLNLGRFYDQKAQILISARRYSEAVVLSQKALDILSDQVTAPALIEARTTHGRALVALGVTYLQQLDPIQSFLARRSAFGPFSTALDQGAVVAALARSRGHILEAASLLNVSHSALIRAIEKYNLKRHPKRRRGKTSVKK